MRKQAGGFVRVRGVMDTGRACPRESTKQDSWGLTETEAATVESGMGLYQVLCLCVMSISLVFKGTYASGSVCVRSESSLLSRPLPPTGLPCQALM